LATAKFSWNWSQGMTPLDGMVKEFRVKCGAASGQYTIVKAFADPAVRSVLASDVLTQVGQYFCVVTAANEFGEGPPSNEVVTSLGRIPAPATGYSVVLP